MNTLLTLALLCISIYGSYAASTQLNQIWWQKFRTPSVGCANMCCDGRNSSCHSTGLRMNGKGSSSGRCFCDGGCMDMNDCCEDYSMHCQAVDCEVGDWTDYSECSRPCGRGVMTRERDVIQEPRNGGLECPVLKETTTCSGNRCKSPRHLGISRGRVEEETAKIMPFFYAKFRALRRYNPSMDIRKNLYYRYYAPYSIDRNGYCSTFKITSANSGCKTPGKFWSNVLTEGTRICVECQEHAMDGTRCVGHGEQGIETKWSAVNSRDCTGWWTREEELSDCSCLGKQKFGFIFV